MKAAFVIIATAFGSVAAINLDGIPDCAIPCLEEAIPKVGCSLSDTACQCSTATQEKLVSVVSPCLIKKCSANELNQAQEAAGAACAAYSATAAKPATGTPTAKATTTVTSTAQVTATKVVTTPGAVTTPASNGTATGTAKSSHGGSGSNGGSSATGTGSSSQPTSTTNAGAVAGPAIGALLAVFAAALAM